MAHTSDVLLTVTLLVYLAAFLGYLVEFAFGTRGAVARVAARPERELVSVGAEAAASTAWDLPDTAPAAPASPVVDPRAEKAGSRSGVAGIVGAGLTVVGLGLHIAVLVTRGLAAGHVPWSNMYEFVVALTAVFTIGWLVLLAVRPAMRPLGIFITAALVVLLGFAGLVLTAEAGPLTPPLQSSWLKIHVSAAAIASGLLLLGFVPAALYLVRSAYEAGRFRPGLVTDLADRLPSADRLERLTFRLHTFAFPIWTLAIICGAIWAESAWGRYWGWDPKETWSFISWVAYAAYLHARATPSVKRTVATWFSVAAGITMVINLYVINFVAVGMHSYAGVE